MSFFKSRLRKVEQKSRSEMRCAECGLSPDGKGRIIFSDQAGPSVDLDERCIKCGRPLFFVIEVGSAEEGKDLITLEGGGGSR